MPPMSGPCRFEQAWPKLPAVQVGEQNLLAGPLEEDLDAAGQTALINRLDLMNARAELVDAWRQIAVVANSLLGVFNVQVSYG